LLPNLVAWMCAICVAVVRHAYICVFIHSHFLSVVTLASLFPVNGPDWLRFVHSVAALAFSLMQYRSLKGI
jgi:hypothetical protein